MAVSWDYLGRKCYLSINWQRHPRIIEMKLQWGSRHLRSFFHPTELSMWDRGHWKYRKVVWSPWGWKCLPRVGDTWIGLNDRQDFARQRWGRTGPFYSIASYLDPKNPKGYCGSIQNIRVLHEIYYSTWGMGWFRGLILEPSPREIKSATLRWYLECAWTSLPSYL